MYLGSSKQNIIKGEVSISKTKVGLTLKKIWFNPTF